MISSYWVCLLFFLWHAVAAVSNRKTDTLLLSRDLVFCDSIYGEGVDGFVSAGLVRLFEIWLLFVFQVELSFWMLGVCSQ